MIKKIAYVVNVDWFFISHRLPLAIEALKKGYQVFVISKDTGNGEQLRNYGIEFINISFDRSGRNIFREFKLIWQLREIYKKLQPDIIHHITLKPCIYGTIAAKRLKTFPKIINAVSGLGYSFANNSRSISTKLLVLLLKYAFKDKSTSFIFQNPDDCTLYSQFGFLNTDNFVIIKGAGVSEKDFKYSSPKPKLLLEVVLVARMLKDKGVNEYINAAEQLRSEFEGKVVFKLIGGEDLQNPAHISHEDLLRKCDGNYINWLGQRNDIKLIYEDSDIVCLPSYREGLPKSLIEAMAIGRPIITTDAPGCRECVNDGVNGFLVPVKNVALLAGKIKYLILNKDLRISMGLESREKMINEMSLHKIVEQTFYFYEKAY